MNKVVIIHLSDIHFDNSEENQALLDNLIKDLKLMKAEVGKYDLLAITGDCVDKGRVDLYNSFKKQLNKILTKSDIKSKRKIIIVPGNHDISHENVWFKGIQSSNENNNDKINENIEKDFSPILTEYNEFIKDYECPASGIGVKYFKCNGLTVRAIFINSSWSTLTNKKYGKLIIGQSQLNTLKNEIANKKKYDLTIACMHHSLDWFTYNDRIKLQEFLFNTAKINFLFHGHIHEASYDSIINMDTATCIFCTGISYHKTGENCSRKDGMRYSIYEIDMDTHTVNVYLRSTNTQGEFVGDNRLYSKVNKDGFFTTPIGNITECLFPIKTANSYTRNSIFTNCEFVELLLRKEENLFRFYCKMERNLENLLSQKNSFIENWKTNSGKTILTNKEKKQCEKEFYKEQFELYCMYILNDLNALFFENHKNVRFLLRRYDPKSHQHIAVFAEGIHSSQAEIEKIKNFTWGEGMIYNSYKCKSALLMSNNMNYHKDGNTKGVWKEYLTIAIGGIEIKNSRELIPLFAMNIATESLENERCLQALAISSIYNKMQEVFNLFQVKGTDLIELYDLQ